MTRSKICIWLLWWRIRKSRVEWNSYIVIWEIWDVTILVVMCWWLLDIVSYREGFSLTNNLVFSMTYTRPLLPSLCWSVVNPIFSLWTASLMRYSGYFGHIVTICLPACICGLFYVSGGEERGDIVRDGQHQLLSHTVLYCPPVISQYNYQHPTN